MSVVAAYRWVFALVGLALAAAGASPGAPAALGALLSGLAAAAIVAAVAIQLAALLLVPATSRTAADRQALRRWERRAATPRLCDPDAAGRSRPRAPSA